MFKRTIFEVSGLGFCVEQSIKFYGRIWTCDRSPQVRARSSGIYLCCRTRWTKSDVNKTFSMGHNRRQNPWILSLRHQTQVLPIKRPIFSTREQWGLVEKNVTCILPIFFDWRALYVTNRFTKAKWLTNTKGGRVREFPGSKNADKVEGSGDFSMTVHW